MQGAREQNKRKEIKTFSLHIAAAVMMGWIYIYVVGEMRDVIKSPEVEINFDKISSLSSIIYVIMGRIQQWTIKAN